MNTGMADAPFQFETISRSGTFNMSHNHSHNTYEIYYMRSGERFYFIKDRSYHVRPGDLVLIEPNVLHKTTEAYTVSHERVLINFAPDCLSAQMADIGLDVLAPFGDYPLIRLDGADKDYVEGLLDRMRQEQEKQEPGAAGCMKLLLAELLVWVYRYSAKTAPAESERAEHPTTLHRKVSDIVQYINDTYMEPLSLKTVAERFHISPYYLCHIFKEATGFTLLEYVHRMRVREAQKLLLATRLPMTAVAERVGFESGTHFGRVFKSVCGLSPLQYRKSAAAPSGSPVRAPGP